MVTVVQIPQEKLPFVTIKIDKILLKWVLEKYCATVWTGVSWLKIKTRWWAL
jgi:hypothetical protein